MSWLFIYNNIQPKNTMKKRTSRPPAPGSFIEVDGIRIHLQQEGTGAPELVFLHGFLASSAIWEPMLHGLSPFGRVIAVDMPGSGYSEKPVSAPYSLPWLADFTVKIMDELKLEKPILGGHSLGGAVAMHAALRHPKKVHALVLVSPFVYAPLPPPGLRIAKIWPGPMRAFFRSRLGRMFIAGMVRRAVYSSGRKQELVQESTKRLLQHLDADGGWDAATKIGLAAHEYSPGSDMIKRISQPSLVLWGGQDRAHRVKMGEDLVKELAGPSELAVFEGAAHNCHEEEPERFCSLVHDWIQRMEGEK